MGLSNKLYISYYSMIHGAVYYYTVPLVMLRRLLSIYSIIFGGYTSFMFTPNLIQVTNSVRF